LSPVPDTLDQLLRLHGAEELGRNYVIVRLARYNIAGHIDYSETSRILSDIRRRADWYPVWSAAADRHETLARAAEAVGAAASAGDAYLRASLCSHWASMFATGSDKSSAHLRSLELYRAAMPCFEFTTARVEVPFDGDVLPGYFRCSRGDDPSPIVLFIGGADTNKEELHHWGTEFLRRGMSVLAFDGPGQGELSARYGRLVMRLDDFHRAVAAVIDHVTTTESGVDPARLGIFGNSLGGFLALDAAMRDARVKAVISNGGFCDARSIDAWPAPVFAAFGSCLGFDDAAETRAHIEGALDLSAGGGDHRPPALVVHGGKEDLSTEEESRDAAETAAGTLLVLEDAWHTCTNRDHVVSPVFGDWMWRALHDDLPEPRPTEIRGSDETVYPLLLGDGAAASSR
jgi:2,6-dihydroxypseudooxynicotine hydrolase